MINFKEMLICIFFGLCVYYAMFITDYFKEKRDKQSELVQVHLYACAITAFVLAMLTAITSMIIMMLLGVHNGYWLVAATLTLAAGFFLVKYIWEKVLPETIVETRLISGFVYFLGVGGAAELGILGIFWAISIVTGIAVQYACLPFKI